MIRAISFLCALLLMTLPITPAWAAETADNQSTLIAGIVEAPPFAIKDGDGNWTGSPCVCGGTSPATSICNTNYGKCRQPTSWRDGKLTAVVTAAVTAERENFSHLSRAVSL